MALEDVEKQVAANGRNEADRIAKQAKAEASNIMADARAEAQKIKTEYQENASQQVDRLRQRYLSAANLEVKKARLGAEKEVLAYVRDSFFTALKDMPKEKREEALKKLAAMGGMEKGRVYASEQDAELVRKVTGLEFAGNIDCLGGLVVESEDGSVSMVYTFDTIAEDVWSSDSKKVYELLFG